MSRSAEDRSRLRWRTASALALALHALAVGLLLAGREVAGTDVAADHPAWETPVEVDLVAPPMDGANEPLANGAPSPGVDRSAAPEPSATRAIARGPSPEPAPSGAAENAPPMSPIAAPNRHIDLAIGDGDWSRWVRPAEKAETPVPPARSAAIPRVPVSRTGGLAEALEAHDREVGIGPAGGVLAAAREAAHGDTAPQLGRATFAITLLSTGSVRVELTGANASVDGWRAVGASMQAALASKPPSIPSSRSRVTFELEVVAEEHWPNGNKVRAEGTSVTVAPPKFQAVDEAKEDLARPNPLAAAEPVPQPADRPPLRLQFAPPGVFLEHRGKVCNYAIGVTPLALAFLGGCDPSNIGAKPIRVVATRILRETAL